ncbi:MAG: FG-GAP-like repeat-containing protein, partial [Steroidobacteraceae bacterium]
MIDLGCGNQLRYNIRTGMFFIHRRSSFSLLLASSTLFLAACGGGSSTGGGSTGTTSSVSPAPPAITYSGSQAPAIFSDQNAAVLVDGMFAMTFLALDLANDIGSPAASQPGPFNSTQNGPQGGTVAINGVLNSDGMTGWVQGDFTNYQQSGVTYNGREVIEITQALSNGHAQLGRISYYGLNVVGANLNASYTGTINRSIPSGDPSAVWSVTGAVLIQDLIGQSEWYAQNVDITRTPVSGGMQLNVNSRVYDSQIGYVDVTTPTPWVFVDNVTTPDHGGPLLGTGGNGRTLALSSLTPLLGAITYESAGASQPDRSARITWSSPASQQVGTQELRGKAEASSSAPLPPIADTGAAAVVAPGTTRMLDGRFSYQPNGDFLGFNWKLRSKPPGSTAALDDPSAVQPSLTFDLPGNYLIELTASDGSVQTTDAMSIAVNQNITHPSTAAQLAPDTRASVGESLSFTVQRPSSFLSDPAISLYMQCQAPDGTTCFVDIDSSNNYTFTPTETGVYNLVLTDLVDQAPLDTQWLAIGGDFRWLPTASVPRAFPSPEFVFTAQGDLNGDGFKDLVVSASDFSLNPTLEIYHGNAAGGFDPAVIIKDGIGGPVAIGDFNGDGRPDLAVTTSNGFDVLLQQADGTLASPQSYSISGCSLPQDGAYLAAADFNGDGRTDLVVGGFCRQLVLFTQGADGLMHQGPSISIPGGGAGQFAVGDLNGDGLADLVIGLSSFTPNIMIIPGDRT